MLVNTGKEIRKPKIGQVVFFQPWQGKNDNRKKAYPVIITDGQYMGTHGVSNFWYWQRLTPSGRIKPEVEHGYGNFTEASGWELERKVIVVK